MRPSPWKKLANLCISTIGLLVADLMGLFRVVVGGVACVTKVLARHGADGYIMLLAIGFPCLVFVGLFIQAELSDPAAVPFAILVWAYICALRTIIYFGITKDRRGTPEMLLFIALFMWAEWFNPPALYDAMVAWAHICAVHAVLCSVTKEEQGVVEILVFLGLFPHLLEGWLLVLDTGLRLCGLRGGAVVFGPLVTYSIEAARKLKQRIETIQAELPDTLDAIWRWLKTALRNHEEAYLVANPAAKSPEEFFWELIGVLQALLAIPALQFAVVFYGVHCFDQLTAQLPRIHPELVQGARVLTNICIYVIKGWRAWPGKCLLLIGISRLLHHFAVLDILNARFGLPPDTLYMIGQNFLGVLITVTSLCFIAILWWTKCPGRYDPVIAAGRRAFLLAIIITCVVFLVSYKGGGNFW